MEKVFEEAKLGRVSRELAQAVFAAFPDFRTFATMFDHDGEGIGEADGSSLWIKVAAPGSNPDLQIIIWVDEVATPSFEFGPTHCHETPDSEGYRVVVDRLRSVFADQLVAVYKLDGPCAGRGTWLNLSVPEELLDLLTDPWSATKVRIESWTGKADREISLADLSS